MEGRPAHGAEAGKALSRVVTIGIDARAATEVPAGRGRFVRELLAALARRDDPHGYRLYLRKRWEEPLDDRFEQIVSRLPDVPWHLATAIEASSTCDVFFSTNSYLTCWFVRIPSAVMVHDLIAFLPTALPQRRAALIERATIRPALTRADAAVCNSEATRRDLARFFPSAARKARVVRLAAGSNFGEPAPAAALEAVRHRYRLDRPFVLSTGTLEPRKNLVRLVEAWASLEQQARAGAQLVLVGPPGWHEPSTLAKIARRDDVVLLGYVPDEDLAALYQLCELFCYPSLYEGFGLPLLEAMQSGAACLTSRVSSLPEVGGDAVRYVDDPRDVASLREGLRALLGSPEERVALGARARCRAERFAWQEVADEILTLLTSVARRRRAFSP